MGVEVIVLNGGSSSGKSSLVACLQGHLDGTWLALGVDDLIRELSHGPFDTSAGGTFAVTPEGSVIVGDAFRAAELAWYEGLAAVARAGTRLIIDEVFLGGGSSQARLRSALRGLSVVWIGVRCDAAVAEARERRRGDRSIGMARDQAERVHRGVHYDMVVETDDEAPGDCARAIVGRMASREQATSSSGRNLHPAPDEVDSECRAGPRVRPVPTIGSGGPVSVRPPQREEPLRHVWSSQQEGERAGDPRLCRRDARG